LTILSGTISTPRRPAGWRASGSGPAAPADQPELWPQRGEDLCLLSGDWRILQLRRGHRWSLDDLVTAWFAACQSAAPRRIADLGCGIGAVLLMLAWRFAAARCVGIEAEESSAALARRSIAWNGAHDRCEVRRGDLRDEVILANEAPFDLVTATPPYLPPGTGRHATRPQQAYCNIEQRGGIEAYCRAAARVLAADGRFVVCHADPRRVARAASETELTIACAMEVIPRIGKAALFSVYSLQRAPMRTTTLLPLVVRDDEGQWTDEFRAVRSAMGMPAGI
jgi:tRNA1(Val) A37 N6-methylase TrmN6